MIYDRRTRMAIDELKDELIEREQALRAVQKLIPQANFEDCKTAAAVYLAALDFVGIDTDALQICDATSLKAILDLGLAKQNGDLDNRGFVFAQDRSLRGRTNAKKFADMFPDAARIKLS